MKHLLLLLIMLAGFGHAPQSAAAQRPSIRCTASSIESHLLTLDCTPGYASAHDQLLIHSTTPFNPDQPWRDQLNDTNAAWIFDAQADGTANIVVVFDRQDERVRARVFDDLDGDGAVLYQANAGQVTITEAQGRPTVTITAQNGWRNADDAPNMNVDLQIDGAVVGMIDSEIYLDKLATDGGIDLEAHVRDIDNDGHADYEWRQAHPPLNEEDGFYHSSVMVNTADDEPQIRNDLFWPWLGSGASNFIKADYNAPTAAPINVDWERSKITHLGESVASRAGAHNYFVYSIRRIVEGQRNDVNFESPFAFYQLGNENEPFPNVAARVAYWPQGDHADHLPVQQVDYSWRHGANASSIAPTWDYVVNLLGSNAYQGEIVFPDFTLNITPYDQLPRWITGNNWNYATFVAREDDAYVSSEGFYEWATLEGVIADVEQQDRTTVAESRLQQEAYARGETDQLSTELYSTIRPGLRGEARGSTGPVRLYVSPLDHKLHLLGADHGVWSVDENAEVRYANLDNDAYLDQWRYAERTPGSDTFTVTQQLNVAPDHIVYSDKDSVVLRRATIEPSLFEAAPPATTAQWQALGEQIKKHARTFAPDDLRAMQRQASGPELQIDGATLRDYRSTAGGFRFVLTLQRGFTTQGKQLFDVRDLAPGEYAVTYDGTFHIEPLTPPQLAATVNQASFTALQPNAVPVVLHNTGREDVAEATIELWAASGDAPTTLVATDTVALLAESTVTTTLDWTPPAAGTWQLTPHVQLPDQPVTALSTTEHTVLAAGVASPKEMFVVSTSRGTRAGIMLGLTGLAGAVAATFWYLSRSRMGNTDAA